MKGSRRTARWTLGSREELPRIRRKNAPGQRRVVPARLPSREIAEDNRTTSYSTRSRRLGVSVPERFVGAPNTRARNCWPVSQRARSPIRADSSRSFLHSLTSEHRDGRAPRHRWVPQCALAFIVPCAAQATPANPAEDALRSLLRCHQVSADRDAKAEILGLSLSLGPGRDLDPLVRFARLETLSVSGEATDAEDARDRSLLRTARARVR